MPFKDPEKKKAWQKEYMETYDYAGWCTVNPEKVKANTARHQKRHSAEIVDRKRKLRNSDPVAMAKHMEHGAKRRARVRSQLCDCCTREDLFEFWVIAQAKTEETGIPHEVDHIDPICNGGAHCCKNLRVITKEENRKKAYKVA